MRTQSRLATAGSFADHGNVIDRLPKEKARTSRAFWERDRLFRFLEKKSGYSAGDGFFRNSPTRLSHSSILAPWRFMMTPCWRIDSELFQAQ